MKTTLELQQQSSGIDKKRILENLKPLENIWNISVQPETATVSFEYLSEGDLEKVRRELSELGYAISNDTRRFDAPRNGFV